MRRNLFHCSDSQQGATDKVTLLFGITIFFKFLLFDFIWSIPTTFASFSTIEFYATKIIATLVLLVPYKFFRLWKTEIVIMLLLDILLIVNLMYFRTYYTRRFHRKRLRLFPLVRHLLPSIYHCQYPPLLALQKKYRRKNIIQVLRRSFGNRYSAVYHHHPGQRRIQGSIQHRPPESLSVCKHHFHVYRLRKPML